MIWSLQKANLCRAAPVLSRYIHLLQHFRTEQFCGGSSGERDFWLHHWDHVLHHSTSTGVQRCQQVLWGYCKGSPHWNLAWMHSLYTCEWPKRTESQPIHGNIHHYVVLLSICLQGPDCMTRCLWLLFQCVQGICMIIGGIKHREQRFNSRSAGVSSALLFISVGGVYERHTQTHSHTHCLWVHSR